MSQAASQAVQIASQAAQQENQAVLSGSVLPALFEKQENGQTLSGIQGSAQLSLAEAGTSSILSATASQKTAVTTVTAPEVALSGASAGSTVQIGASSQQMLSENALETNPDNLAAEKISSVQKAAELAGHSSTSSASKSKSTVTAANLSAAQTASQTENTPSATSEQGTQNLAAHAASTASETERKGTETSSSKEKSGTSLSSVTLHSAGGASSVATASAHLSGQNLTYDSAGASRDLTATQPVNQSHASPAESSTATTLTGANTFAALDSAGSPNTTWVHTGAHRAEAGFQDPNLGWVSVRAELNGGSVHASVVPSSASAAESLGQHLSGLQSYLDARESPVSSLSMASPEGQQGGTGQNQNAYSGAEQNMNRATAQGMGGGTGSAEITNENSDVYQPFLREGSSISLIA